jgi:hypothetical protein
MANSGMEVVNDSIEVVNNGTEVVSDEALVLYSRAWVVNTGDKPPLTDQVLFKYIVVPCPMCYISKTSNSCHTWQQVAFG